MVVAEESKELDDYPDMHCIYEIFLDMAISF
jgi:hypothetical protein